MNVIQQGVITLMKSALTEEKLVMPEGFDIAEAYPQIKSHKIASMIYDGAVRCGVSQQHPIMQKLFQSYCKAIQVNERQMRELDRIYAAFDANGIDYMPLKGSIMKALYPKPELRMMGDADILIRLEQYEKIIPIMEELGFQAKGESAYDFTWTSDSLYLELHKSVVSPREVDFYACFGDGWSMARGNEGNRYFMTAEDSFIYLFAHFAKHYRGAGIGCRHVVDLWVFLRTNPMLDEAYIKVQLDKMHLWTFYQNMRRTIAMWFEDGISDDRAEVITDCIFSNGSWGTHKALMLSWSARDMQRPKKFFKGRIAYIMRRIFPNADTMRMRYPLLKKTPYLLPVIWLYYLISKSVFTKGVWRRHVRNLSVLTKDNVETRRQMLSFVGLDFNH